VHERLPHHHPHAAHQAVQQTKRAYLTKQMALSDQPAAAASEGLSVPQWLFVLEEQTGCGGPSLSSMLLLTAASIPPGKWWSGSGPYKGRATSWCRTLSELQAAGAGWGLLFWHCHLLLLLLLVVVLCGLGGEWCSCLS
jgi:hypothetical protein